MACSFLIGTSYGLSYLVLQGRADYLAIWPGYGWITYVPHWCGEGGGERNGCGSPPIWCPALLPSSTAHRRTLKILKPKTVFLRERKRHTAHRVANTRSALPGWEYPCPGQRGHTPGQRYLPCLGLGYPPKWDRGSPPTWDQWKYYGMEMGYPPPKRTWDQWKYYGMEIGYSLPPGCEQRVSSPSFRCGW